jgi:hypothetical protein
MGLCNELIQIFKASLNIIEYLETLGELIVKLKVKN